MEHVPSLILISGLQYQTDIRSANFQCVVPLSCFNVTLTGFLASLNTLEHGILKVWTQEIFPLTTGEGKISLNPPLLQPSESSHAFSEVSSLQ